MNIIQRSITAVSETSDFISDWTTTKFYVLTHPNTPNQNGKANESQEPTHPVWNGDLDEPIWW